MSGWIISVFRPQFRLLFIFIIFYFLFWVLLLFRCSFLVEKYCEWVSVEQMKPSHETIDKHDWLFWLELTSRWLKLFWFEMEMVLWSITGRQQLIWQVQNNSQLKPLAINVASELEDFTRAHTHTLSHIYLMPLRISKTTTTFILHTHGTAMSMKALVPVQIQLHYFSS